MNRRTLGIFLIIIGLTGSILGIHTYSFLSTTQTQTQTLDPSESIFAQLELSQGDQVKGTLSVIEGTEGIRVYLENPSKAIIYDSGIVYTSLDFSLNTQTSGMHKIIFNNSSPVNTQNIEFSLTYPAKSQKNLSITISILGLLIAVIGIILFFFQKE